MKGKIKKGMPKGMPPKGMPMKDGHMMPEMHEEMYGKVKKGKK